MQIVQCSQREVLVLKFVVRFYSFTIFIVLLILIAREVNCGCYLNAGREVAVASTKSFTSQVIILTMISIWFCQKK